MKKNLLFIISVFLTIHLFGKEVTWVLVYSEDYESKTKSLQREKQLKSWKNRERIESLIKSLAIGSEHPD